MTVANVNRGQGKARADIVVNPGAGAIVRTFAPAPGVLCALTLLFVSSGVKISGLMDSWGLFFRIMIHLLQKL